MNSIEFVSFSSFIYSKKNMTSINRRAWLKKSALVTVGLSSIAASGLNTMSLSNNHEFEHYDSDEFRRLLYNENPNGPSNSVKKNIESLIYRSNRYSTFHRYDFKALKTLIAKQEGLDPENVLLGHGSFELLIWAAIHFGSKGEEIVVPSPTFDVVGSFAKKIGAKVIPVEVDFDFKMNLKEMASRVGSRTSLVTICNPNNPTGTTTNTHKLKDFCTSVSDKCPVLIDEAYIHYLNSWRQHTMAPLIKKGKNILITRTFSKIYGMAGLRIGFMLGSKELIKKLESKFTLGFPGNMPNSLSVAAAITALNDISFVKESRTTNEKSRLNFYKELDVLGLPFIPSTTNFVYFDVTKFKAYKQLMLNNKILLAGGWPSKPNWARVTMGSINDMSYLIDRMKGKKWM